MRILIMELCVILACGSMDDACANSRTSKTLLIYETVGLAPEYAVTFKAYTSTLAYSQASGLSFNLAAAQEQGVIAGAVAQLPAVPAQDGQGHPYSETGLLSAANAMVAGYAQSLASQMASSMTSSGAASGIFNFAQQVMVQGNQSPMYLVWQEIVDVTGRPRYGNFALVPGSPNYLYGEYTSLAVAKGLPASFAYPQGGDLQWEPIKPMSQPDQAPQPLGNSQTIDLSGQFDAPVAASTATSYPPGCQPNANGIVACDPDHGLKCLINHTSDPYSTGYPNPLNPADTGCPVVPINGFSDFMTLLSSQGAAGGYVDYVRSLQPVYVSGTNAQGQTVQTAQITVSVNSRIMHQSPACQLKQTVGWSTSGGWFCHAATLAICAEATGTVTVVLPQGSLDHAKVGQILSGGLSNPGPGFSGPAQVTITSLVPGYCPGTCYQCDATGTATLTSAGGGGSGAGTYINSGEIGYEVLSMVNRYFVTPDGQYSLVGTVTTTSQAPAQAYSKTVSLPQGASAGSYADTIIDPFLTNQLYDYMDDYVNGLPPAAYVYVAPIVLQ